MQHKLTDKDIRMVNGGLVTPLGEFAAKDLIDMYNEEPAKAISYITFAKKLYPGLVDEFRKECAANKLTIPEELDKLLG